MKNNKTNTDYIINGIVTELSEVIERANYLQKKLSDLLNGKKKVANIKVAKKYEESSEEESSEKSYEKSNESDDSEYYDDESEETEETEEEPEEPDKKNIVTIKSKTTKGQTYRVDYQKKTCTCPSFEYSKKSTCKHLEDVLSNTKKYGIKK
jgi:hypothetical protein